MTDKLNLEEEESANRTLTNKSERESKVFQKDCNNPNDS